MNQGAPSARRILVGGLLLSALLTGRAGAQDLVAYRTLAQSLDQAAATVATDRAAANAQLAQANTALVTLLPTLPGGLDGQVARSLRSTVTQAQSAVSRTPAEVQANVLLARGLMRRALYDQALQELQPAASPSNDSPALQLLGRELGFSPANLASLRAQARAGELEVVKWRLRKVAGTKVASALNAVTPQGAQTSNYLNLTRASSWFTLVAEEGQKATPPLSVAQLQQALQHVTTNDRAALKAELAQMQAGANDLSRRLSTPPASLPTTSTQPNAGGTGSASAPVTPPTQVTATPGALDTVYATLARAMNAAGHGDPASARAALSQTSSLLAGVPEPLRATDAFAQAQRDVQTLQYRSGLRTEDIQSLMATLGSAEAQAARRAVVGSDGFSAATSRTFGGWVRVFLAFALGALALLPIYLLNLAFGGSNVYWRSISAGLFVLTLPLMLEGLFGIIGWIGDLLSVPLLRGAVNLTPSQGAGGALLQALCSALGLLLMAYGFRGLCRQFGLLGPRVSSKTSARPASRYTQTGLDWDEEL